MDSTNPPCRITLKSEKSGSNEIEAGVEIFNFSENVLALRKCLTSMAEPGGPEGGGGEGQEVVECVVEFDYVAELNDELTLRVR